MSSYYCPQTKFGGVVVCIKGGSASTRGLHPGELGRPPLPLPSLSHSSSTIPLPLSLPHPPSLLGYYRIRSMAGRHPSYWNAFLFTFEICYRSCSTISYLDVTLGHLAVPRLRNDPYAVQRFSPLIKSKILGVIPLFTNLFSNNSKSFKMRELKFLF